MSEKAWEMLWSAMVLFTVLVVLIILTCAVAIVVRGTLQILGVL